MNLKIEHLSHSEEVSMSDDWYEITNKDHFWMEWRFEILKKFKRFFPLISKEILEIGCGNAVLTEQFESLGYTVDGCDLNLHALQQASEIKGKLMVYNIYDRQPQMLNKYSMVILADIIEHIDDDLDFLKVALEYLKPGGIVAINVPASMLFFSKYDTVVGHKRRYNKLEIKNLFNKLDLEVLSVNYWGLSLIPLLFVRKLVLRFSAFQIIQIGMKPPNQLVHSILKLIMKIENDYRL